MSELLAGLARWLRQRDDVSSVKESFSVTRLQLQNEGEIQYGVGDGVGVVWFVDAEFREGNALSFGLELNWDHDEWVVEPGLRITHLEGQDDLVDLAKRFAADDTDMEQELLGAVRGLIKLRDEALQAFLAWQANADKGH